MGRGTATLFRAMEMDMASMAPIQMGKMISSDVSLSIRIGICESSSSANPKTIMSTTVHLESLP
jgi:hypothetical protein